VSTTRPARRSSRPRRSSSRPRPSAPSTSGWAPGGRMGNVRSEARSGAQRTAHEYQTARSAVPRSVLPPGRTRKGARPMAGPLWRDELVVTLDGCQSVASHLHLDRSSTSRCSLMQLPLRCLVRAPLDCSPLLAHFLAPTVRADQTGVDQRPGRPLRGSLSADRATPARLGAVDPAVRGRTDDRDRVGHGLDRLAHATFRSPPARRPASLGQQLWVSGVSGAASPTSYGHAMNNETGNG
jgi:hypothetical protein